ncbi:MAG: hypothetical protein HC808_16255 [Candidatus Competibacteraceae bacterium]|nr:hypothetical protein [Candidatus Competibacteraceae bacterium]
MYDDSYKQKFMDAQEEGGITGFNREFHENKPVINPQQNQMDTLDLDDVEEDDDDDEPIVMKDIREHMETIDIDGEEDEITGMQGLKDNQKGVNDDDELDNINNGVLMVRCRKMPGMGCIRTPHRVSLMTMSGPMTVSLSLTPMSRRTTLTRPRRSQRRSKKEPCRKPPRAVIRSAPSP